jgi:hypothetical protein
LYRRLDNSYECLSQYIIDNFRIWGVVWKKILNF